MAMIRVGIHADNWRCLSGSLSQAVEAAKRLGVEEIEFGSTDGHEAVVALGYGPTVSLDSNPIKLRRYLEDNGILPSQLDAAFPMAGPLGSTFGVRYVQRAIQFAHAIGCPCVGTTDGQFKPEGYTDEETLAIMKENYRQILEWAADYEVIVNIEPHGPFTTNPDGLDRILNSFDTPWFRVNFDTGNSFIAGHEPPAFLKRFLPKVSHLHIKDVSEDLAAAVRGESTGIPTSHCAVGQGVNAENIKACIKLLKEAGWDGGVSIECLATDEVLSDSVAWVREQIANA